MTFSVRTTFVRAYAKRQRIDLHTADRILRGLELDFAKGQNEQLASKTDESDAAYMRLLGAITRHFPDGGLEYRPDLHGDDFIVEFICWLPDLTRHQDYGPIGARAPFNFKWGTHDGCDITDGHYHRKSDGMLVPAYLLPKETD